MQNPETLPAELAALIEPIAEKVHQRWMQVRQKQGWTHGEKRNDERKEHPSLIPYEELSEEEKELDRQSARQVFEALDELGYVVRESKNSRKKKEVS